MIRKQVVGAIDQMFERISVAVEAFQPAKADFDIKLPYGPTISTRIAFQHLLYMRDRLLASNKKHDFDTPKANRWLGFIQGVLWSHGVFSINEMGKINGDAMMEVAVEEGLQRFDGVEEAVPSASLRTVAERVNVALETYRARHHLSSAITYEVELAEAHNALRSILEAKEESGHA